MIFRLLSASKSSERGLMPWLCLILPADWDRFLLNTRMIRLLRMLRIPCERWMLPDEQVAMLKQTRSSCLNMPQRMVVVGLWHERITHMVSIGFDPWTGTCLRWLGMAVEHIGSHRVLICFDGFYMVFGGWHISSDSIWLPIYFGHFSITSSLKKIAFWSWGLQVVPISRALSKTE